MPLNLESFDKAFSEDTLFDQTLGGYCFSVPVVQELFDLDDSHAGAVKALSKKMAEIIDAFAKSNPGQKPPQAVAQEIYNALNAIEIPAALAKLQKLLIVNIFEELDPPDWGFKNDASARVQFTRFKEALGQLIFPPRPREVATSTTQPTASFRQVTLYPPQRGVQTPRTAVFDAPQAEFITPLPDRSYNDAKKAVGELEKAIRSRELPFVSTTIDSDKTWSVTIENKTTQPTLIRCIEDRKLTIENMSLGNEKHVAAYLNAVKTMAVGKGVSLASLVIKIDELDPDTAVALAQGAKKMNIQTNVSLAQLGLENHRIHPNKQITLPPSTPPAMRRTRY